MIHDVTPVSQLDWDSRGKRLYHVPFTYDGTWGRMRLPLAVICSGKPGKTLLAIGGTHGDEFEGPVAVKNLVQDLDAADLVSGRLIAIPVLSPPALFASQRHSAADGVNMNRAFPGKADGSLSYRIAHFISSEVFPRADIVVDIHSAGTTHQIAPLMSFHNLPDPAQLEACRETAFLFGTPWIWIYASGMGTGLLTEHAESLGKITIGSELGYGGSTDLAGVRYAYRGLINVMRHHGIMGGKVENLLPAGYDKQRFVQSADLDAWVTAPVSGIFEPLVPLGTYVKKGQPVARMHDFERWDEPGVEIRANLDGYVLVRHFRAPTPQGTVVMVIGQEVQR